MTPYFFKQMRKRTSLCLVVVLTALAFSLALCMLQRSRDQMAARIEEVYDNLVSGAASPISRGPSRTS